MLWQPHGAAAMNIESNWTLIRRLFNRAFRSSLHFSMATVTADGLPHVTPVGSLLLRAPGHAVYFEEFTLRMPLNLRVNPHVCVLAVRSGIGFWLWSALRGRFRTPPAIRLHGTVGAARAATDDELRQWMRRVGGFRRTRGYQMMWANMRTVRDVHFTRADAIQIGAMTRECWQAFGESSGDAANA
jgi:hypothetical protein